MSESPLEVMDVPLVYASAQLAGAPVVSVVSAVASMSPLSSLELDGSPVTQHNKADAAIWNSYRNASTSLTQTSTKIENQLNKVVANTDLLLPLMNLGILMTQTTDTVRGSHSDSSSAGDWQSDDDQPQAVAVEASDKRCEGAQGEGRRLDVDLKGGPEDLLPLVMAVTVDDQVHQLAG